MDKRKTVPADKATFYKQIQEDNAYYKSIIENNSFYIIKTDLEGNYTYMNPFFCMMLGLKAEDWLGKESLSLVLPVDHQICVETVEKCFSEPKNTHWVILRKPAPSGIISTQWEFKLLCNDEGVPTEILCIGHDITPLMLKQQELQALVDVTSEQNKRLVNFTYIISHNIRSHVANIIGIINVMEDEEDSKLAWKMIKESTSSLDETIHNLNDIITVQSNTNLPVSTVYIHQEINRVISSIQVLIDNADTLLVYHFEQDESLITNPVYLESILLNLITNALKYKSPDRPLRLHIDFYKEGKYKVLTVKDNGIGINLDKHKDDLFGMYKTFHHNKDAKGLGLFIIKTQMEAMKGKIKVESEVDKGSTFKLYFNENNL